MLAEALAALDRAVIEAAEAEDALARARRGALAFDPARLEEAEARLFEIRALARKHRVEAGRAARRCARSCARGSARSRPAATEIAALEAELAEARAAYDERGRRARPRRGRRRRRGSTRRWRPSWRR